MNGECLCVVMIRIDEGIDEGALFHFPLPNIS